MNECRKILFPVDFADAAAAAAPFVREMAERCGASLTVMHAFDVMRGYELTPPFDALGVIPAWTPYTPAFQELRAVSRERLAQFGAKHFQGIDYRVEMEDGEPARVIEWTVQRHNSDLIMMPTKGRGGFRRLLLGSVTAKVLHDLKCPVWTSAHSPEPGSTDAGGCQSILCAIEMNEEAETVVESAVFLARTFGARLCLLHIGRYPPADDLLSEADPLRKVQRLLEHQPGAKVRLLDAPVAEGIRSAAIEEKADLVVAGRGHATKAFGSIWSSLYAIIRESPCPVLSV